MVNIFLDADCLSFVDDNTVFSLLLWPLGQSARSYYALFNVSADICDGPIHRLSPSG